MSRRARRRGVRKKEGGLWMKAGIGLLVSVLLLSAVGYGILKNYLHSDAFRRFLSSKVSEAAKVEGEFGAFHWDGLAVRTADFSAKGDGPIRSLRADDIRTEVGFSGVKRGVWELRGSSLRRLEVVLDATKKDISPASSKSHPRSPRKEKKSGWLPSEVEPDGLEIRDFTVTALLEQGNAALKEMGVNVRKSGAGKSYQAEIQGGSIHLPQETIPELHLNRARLRYQGGRFFLTESTLGVWERGRIQATGEWEPEAGRYAFEGTIRDLTCENLFNETWAKRVTGDVALDFSVDGLSGEPQARGNLEIRNGNLTALPLLDALAAYADTRRFRMLALHEARTGWRWQKGEWAFTDLVLASEGLVRLEGSLIVRGEKLDGIFRLGLIPGTLSTIPGAETDVFLPGERGMLWTPLRITGTLKNPKEDLTDRLIAAAGVRMFEQIPETGERVLKFTRSILGDSSSETVRKGVETLEKGVKILDDNREMIRDVGGILGGLLGNESSRPREPEEIPEIEPPPMDSK